MIRLLPAYGRMYVTKAQALEQWAEGFDFKIIGGPYTSVRDINFLIEHFDEIKILWNGYYDPIIINEVPECLKQQSQSS